MKPTHTTLAILTKDEKFQALVSDLKVLVTRGFTPDHSRVAVAARTDMPVFLINAGYTAMQFGALFAKPALNLPDNAYPSHGVQLLMALNIKVNARLRALVGVRDLKNHNIEQVTVWMFKQFAEPQSTNKTLQKTA